MSLPAHHLSTTRVLTAIAGDHLLAFPSAATGLITTCPSSAPPLGAAPWFAGVATWRGQVLWVLDLVGFGRTSARSADPLMVVVDTGEQGAGWAVTISAPANLTDATPIAGDLLTSCPSDWLRPCLLQDGRRAWLVDTVVIATALRQTVAA